MSENYYVSDNKHLLSLKTIHEFLSSSYWAKNIPMLIMQKAIDNSFTFGVYTNKDEQVGFARVITDYATFAYLADVFILEKHRGKGLSKMLIQYILKQPSLQGLRRMVLVTADAHKLYEGYGFTPLNKAEGFMEIWQPTIYSPKT
ncbi:GNAT family N-acetyltransferase [Colwelliaceae bacterium 6441]